MQIGDRIIFDLGDRLVEASVSIESPEGLVSLQFRLGQCKMLYDFIKQITGFDRTYLLDQSNCPYNIGFGIFRDFENLGNHINYLQTLLSNKSYLKLNHHILVKDRPLKTPFFEISSSTVNTIIDANTSKKE